MLTGDGGEFSSDEMRGVISSLNVRLVTTAAESPLQNGLCIRVGALTDMMLLNQMKKKAKLTVKHHCVVKIWRVIHCKCTWAKTKFTRHYDRQATST